MLRRRVDSPVPGGLKASGAVFAALAVAVVLGVGATSPCWAARIWTDAVAIKARVAGQLTIRARLHQEAFNRMQSAAIDDGYVQQVRAIVAASGGHH